MTDVKQIEQLTAAERDALKSDNACWAGNKALRIIDAHAADRAALVAQLEQTRSDWLEAARVREDLRAQVAELTRQRDEARAELESMTAARDAALELWEAATNERDEAHKALELAQDEDALPWNEYRGREQ